MVVFMGFGHGIPPVLLLVDGREYSSGKPVLLVPGQVVQDRLELQHAD